MLQREGEDPILAVVAVIPNCNEVVTNALEQLKQTLLLHMEEDDIHIMREEAIALNSGRIIQLGAFSLFFSLSYPTVQSRTFEMEFGAPPTATIH